MNRQAQQVKCGKCGALPGDPCTRDGVPVVTLHAERRNAANSELLRLRRKIRDAKEQLERIAKTIESTEAPDTVLGRRIAMALRSLL